MLGYIFIILVIGSIILNFISDDGSTTIIPTSYKRKIRATRENTKDYGSFASSYVKTPLLTKREWAEYQILKIAADKNGLLICPKVRLLDLVVPKQDAKNSRGLMARVMSKHVDFVICDQNMEVVCIIELDDPTHLQQDRIERDQFVDTVLTGAGYKIIHTWSITADILDFYRENKCRIHIDRKEPTYEEWKAQRLREKAASQKTQS